MRICNNINQISLCGGECWDNGICQSKEKCEDSLVVNETLVKQLLAESGRRERMIKNLQSWSIAAQYLNLDSGGQ